MKQMTDYRRIDDESQSFEACVLLGYFFAMFLNE